MKNIKDYPYRIIFGFLLLIVVTPYLIAKVIEIHVPTGEEIALEHGKIKDEKEAIYIMETVERQQETHKSEPKEEKWLTTEDKLKKTEERVKEYNKKHEEGN